jgi:tetratricopeptide (TPR) repeat protein
LIFELKIDSKSFMFYSNPPLIQLRFDRHTHKIITRGKMTDVNDLLKQARQYKDSGNIASAIDVYSQMLNELKNCDIDGLVRSYTVEVYNERGMLHLNQGKRDQALQDLFKALEHDESLTSGGHIAEKLINDFKDHDLAIDYMTKYLHALGDRADHYDFARRADLYFHMEKYSLAERDYVSGLEVCKRKSEREGTPLNDKWSGAGGMYDGTIRCAGKQQQYNRVISLVNEALRLWPNDNSLFDQRGIAYFELGQFSEALADMKRALDLFEEGTDRQFLAHEPHKSTLERLRNNVKVATQKLKPWWKFW